MSVAAHAAVFLDMLSLALSVAKMQQGIVSLFP